MYIPLFLVLISSLLHATNTMTIDRAEPLEHQSHVTSLKDTQGPDIDLLDELERKTEDIMIRSKTTAEDISKEAHIPTWKRWVMRTGDFMYWTYQAGIDGIQALYGRCKKAITGSD